MVQKTVSVQTANLYGENPGMFSSKTLISFRLKKERDGHLGWHGGEYIISKSFFKVNYSFKTIQQATSIIYFDQHDISDW